MEHLNEQLCKHVRLSRDYVAQSVETIRHRRVEYWANRSSICSFARTAHTFSRSILLALIARSAALIRLLALLLAHFGAHGKEIYIYEIS